MSLGTIVVDLLARTGSFETDTKRAAKIAQQRAKEIDEAFAKAGRAIGLSLAAGAAAAAAAFKATTNRMDELSKAAARASLPTEDFSRLAYAADLADVSMQDLQGAFGRLAKAQADALSGTGEQADAFRALGIEVKNADGSLRNTGDVFREFADKFQQFQGSPEIVAVGMRLFGRSFQNLIPLLKDGAAGLREAGEEADAFGVTLSTQAGQNAERFNDNLTRLAASARGLAMSLTAELLPTLNDLIERFLSARAAGIGFADALDIAANIKGFGTLDEKIAEVQRRLNDAQSGKWTGIFGTDVKGLQAELEKLLALKNRLVGKEMGGYESSINFGDFGFTPPKLRLPSTSKPRAARPEQADLTDEQRTLIAAVGLYTDIEKRASDYAATLEWLDKLYFDNAISAQQYDVAVRQITKSTEKLGDDGVGALQRQADAWLDQLDPMREFTRQLEEVEQVLARGLITEDQAEEIKKRMAEAMQPISEADAWAVEAAKNIQDALGQGLYDILSGNFDNIGKSFGNMLNRMLAEAMAANLARALFGNDFAKGGGLGGLLGEGLKWLGGAFGGARAGGGSVSGGTGYVVGERGPEWFVPNTSGTIVPNGGFGGGLTINSTINAAPGMNVAQMQALLDQRDARLKADIGQGLRRGRYDWATA